MYNTLIRVDTWLMLYFPTYIYLASSNHYSNIYFIEDDKSPSQNYFAWAITFDSFIFLSHKCTDILHHYIHYSDCLVKIQHSLFSQSFFNCVIQKLNRLIKNMLRFLWHVKSKKESTNLLLVKFFNKTIVILVFKCETGSN